MARSPASGSAMCSSAWEHSTRSWSPGTPGPAAQEPRTAPRGRRHEGGAPREIREADRREAGEERAVAAADVEDRGVAREGLSPLAIHQATDLPQPLVGRQPGQGRERAARRRQPVARPLHPGPQTRTSPGRVRVVAPDEYSARFPGTRAMVSEPQRAHREYVATSGARSPSGSAGTSTSSLPRAFRHAAQATSDGLRPVTAGARARAAASRAARVDPRCSWPHPPLAPLPARPPGTPAHPRPPLHAPGEPVGEIEASASGALGRPPPLSGPASHRRPRASDLARRCPRASRRRLHGQGRGLGAVRRGRRGLPRAGMRRPGRLDPSAG